MFQFLQTLTVFTHMHSTVKSQNYTYMQYSHNLNIRVWNEYIWIYG